MTIVQQAVVTLGWQMYWYKQLPYMEIIPYHLVIPLFLVLLDHDALSWWKIGECKDVWLWISTLLLCLITVAVLIFWSITVGGNHGHLQDILGEVMLSWRGVIFFSFWNAAVEDLELCLARRVASLPSDSRCIAETHYQLGIAQGFDMKWEEAVVSLEAAIKVL